MEDFTKEEKMQQAIRIKHLRLSRQMSLEEFSEKLGMSVSGYQKIESGKNAVSRRLLKNIWREFHISADYILFNEQKSFEDVMVQAQQCDDMDKMEIFLYLYRYFIEKKKF